ncbi:MAG: cysteine--tRNA ligase [Dehalococcoidia bacterium]
MRLYNTLTQEVAEFAPLGNEVKMYVCGVTPYDEAHIGHAMSAIVFDTLRRYLEFRGYPVRHVRNFTDIDDKIIDRAAERGEDALALSKRFADRYLADMAAINVLPPTHTPYATEEIPAIIAMVQGLIDKGFAYEAGGDVYYRVTRKPDYGKLSHQSVEMMVEGHRVEPGDAKEHPADFALWKGAKPGEPAWESPWGPGRPGWHIECSAMAQRYLGATLDIHGGGTDLIFPHHENEIAQSEAYTDEPFVRWWLHNGMMRMNGEKMSKSLGNFITIQDAVQRWGADALRLFVLSGTYSKPLNFTEDGLNGNRSGAERLRTAARRPGLPTGSAAVDPSPFREAFIAAMDNDLNSAGAIGVLFDLASAINRGRDAGQSIDAAQATLLELAGVLGLRLEEGGDGAMAAKPFVDLLVEVRRELRANKQYALADLVRTKLGELGITLEDSAAGTTWRA